MNAFRVAIYIRLSREDGDCMTFILMTDLPEQILIDRIFSECSQILSVGK